MISHLDTVGDSPRAHFLGTVSSGVFFWGDGVFQNSMGVMVVYHRGCTKHHFERFILYFKFPADL